MSDPDAIQAVKKAALRLLNFRPRSESELRTRLAQKKLPVDAVDQVIDELEKAGMLNDEKFAKLYALSRIQSRALGKGQICRELQGRGVSAALVSKAMEAIADVDEFEIAKDLAARRLASMKGLSADAKKRRLHGALLRRGFPSGVIFKVLRELLSSREEDQNG